jgi:DNA-binding NtrC family response regulator
MAQASPNYAAAAGLVLLKHQGPFAVVVSDMRMPEMNGIEFLLKVQQASPDTIRVMLTGDSDLQTAIDAVNQGKIFRSLSKPCDKETLVKTLKDCLAQYRLVSAEREISGNTLRGTIYVLTDVLSLVSPAAFSRAVRVRRYVQHVAAKLSPENPWRFEIAAMMS